MRMRWGRRGSRTSEVNPVSTGYTNGHLPPALAARGSDQLGAVLWKNSIIKRRNIKLSFCELFSPPMFIGVLILGYFLTEADQIGASIYVSLSVNLTPLLQDGAAPQSAEALTGTKIVLDVTAPLVQPISNSNSSSSGGSRRSPELDLFGLRDTLLPVIDGPLPALPVDLFGSVSQAAGSSLGEDNIQRLTEQDAYGALFGNIFTLGTLHVSPDTPAVRRFVDRTRMRHAIFDNSSLLLHATEADAIAQLMRTRKQQLTWGLVHFNQLSPTDVDYAIRLNYTTVPNTNQIVTFVTRGIDRTYQRYHLSGFLTLQRLVDAYAFELAADAGYDKQPAPAEEVVLAPFPTAAYEQNIFYFAVQFLLGIILSMCLLLPVSTLTKSIVEEKELRLKQTMTIMGLRHWVFMSSWYISASLLFFLISVFCTLVASIFLTASSGTAVFIYVFLFCAASLSFAILVSVFFSNAILSAIFAPIAFFAMLLPKYVFFGTNRYEETASKKLASVLAPTAFAFGAEILGDYEYAGIGVSMDNWDEGDYSFRTCLSALFIDAILYTVLALYLEQVLPSKYGARLHPLFFLKKSYWMPERSFKKSFERAQQPLGPAYEPVSESVLRGEAIEIIDLVKTYGSGKMKKTAVDGLNLSMYSGQITCLLGHNGAGKTTTLSVLTGLYPATSGDCLVFGYSIKHAMSKVYTLLGICPQHDVLWRSLTVYEHLFIYATLKGVPRKERATAVEAMLRNIGLLDKRHARSYTLSGGMKRKLSVGCALIGGSRAVLLDEPTSGMDPASRRSLWDLLKASTAGRVLVLTTHYMDEADLLADRIAVLSSGMLRCVGSSIFLKSRFGLGYTLSMMKASSECEQQVVTAKLQELIPGAELLSQSGAELSYRLPFASAKVFPRMLRYLDEHQHDMHIHGYGMSVTSMEEVFLRLANGDVQANGAESCETWAPFSPHAVEMQVVDAQLASDHGRSALSDATPAPSERQSQRPSDSWRVSETNRSTQHMLGAAPSPPGLEGAAAAPVPREASVGTEVVASPGQASWAKQLRVLLRKRWQCGRRDVKGFLAKQVLPICLIGLVLLVLTISDPRVGPSIVLDASLYLSVQSSGVIMSHNLPNDSGLLANIDKQAVILQPVAANNSRQLSEFLLETYSDRGADDMRMAGLVKRDTLLGNLTLDVNRLSDQLPDGTANAFVFAASVTLLTCSATRVDVGAVTDAIDGLNVSDVISDGFTDGLQDPTGSVPSPPLQPAPPGSATPPPPAPPFTLSDLFPGLDGELANETLGSVFGVQINQELRDTLVGQLESALSDAQEAADGANVASPISVDDAGALQLTESGVVQAALLEQVCQLAREASTSGSGDRFLSVNDQRLVDYALDLTLEYLGRALADATVPLFPVSAKPLLDVLPSVPEWAQLILELPGGPDGILGQIEVALLTDQQRAQLELFRVYNDFLNRLEAFERGEPLALTELEGRTLFLDEFLGADAQPLSIELGGWAFSNLAIRFARAQLTQSELRLQTVRLFATGQPPDDEPSVVIVVALDEVRASEGKFVATGLSYNAGRYGSDELPDIYATTNSRNVQTAVVRLPTPITLLTNSSSPHGVSAFLGEITRASWREMHGMRGRRLDDAEVEQFAYVVRNHPLPLTAEQEIQTRLVLAFFAGLFILIPFCFIPASVAAFVVKERVCKAKHLQLVSGTNAYVYWAANYLWDMCMYFIIVVSAMLLFLLYDEPAFVGNFEQSIATFLNLFLYGASTVPLCYCYSFLFRSSATAQIVIIILNLVSGFVFVIAHQVMQALPNTQDADAILVNFYRLLPPYNFGEALLRLAQGWYFAELDGTDPTPLADISQALWVMPCEGILFFTILALLENPHALHYFAMRAAKLLCGSEHASLSCALRSRLAFAACSCLAFVLLVLGITSAVGSSGEEEQTALNTRSDSENERPTEIAPDDDDDDDGSSAAGGLFLMILSLLLLCCSAACCVAYERRLRRRGKTMEARAVAALSGGQPYKPDDDVGAEQELVQQLIERYHKDDGASDAIRRIGRLARLRGRRAQKDDVGAVEVGAASNRVGSLEGDGLEAAVEPVVLIDKLEKIYPSRGQAPPKVALASLSLQIPDAECFGFLGVNGAGKSTTMAILTGDTLPTSGRAWISGHDVVGEAHDVRDQIGYCPQHDPLLELMTAREMLTMFARIKNIDEAKIPALVEDLIEHVTLTPYADRVCGSYSGGNKRKLSLAIALIGSPAVVFLDEPSSGMDPVARRKMWDIITIERNRRSIVLTTHSMEECEALCTRIGIMTGGRFRCLGSQQRLKSKFGGGYTLELRCEAAKCSFVKATMPTLLPGAQLVDEHANKLKFQLASDNGVSLADVFELVEARKAEFGVLDYSASQPTLENIFLTIVGAQEDNIKEVPLISQSVASVPSGRAIAIAVEHRSQASGHARVVDVADPAAEAQPPTAEVLPSTSSTLLQSSDAALGLTVPLEVP